MSLEHEPELTSQEIIIDEVIKTWQQPGDEPSSSEADTKLPVNEYPEDDTLVSPKESDQVFLGGHIISYDERDAIVTRAADLANAFTVPDHILKRSAAARQKAREKAALAASQPGPTGISPTVSKILAEKLFLTGVPECSIAASDAAKLAQERFESKTQGEPIQIAGQEMHRVRFGNYARLRMVDEVECQDRDVNVNWITKPMPTTSGYPVRLGLAKSYQPNPDDKGAHPDDITLVAELRHGLAFPLVHFSRSSQAYCDYLQFYGEENLTELEATNLYGWSEDDNGSRFDAVQLVIEQLKNQSATDIKPLTDALKLDQRISAQLGKYNAQLESIMDSLFEPLPAGGVGFYEQEHPNVDTGKYTTNVTVAGKVELMPESMYMRKLTMRQFPSSQPEGNWPEVVLQADQHGSVAFVDHNNNLSKPTPADLELISALLSSPVEEASTSLVPSSKNSLAKSKGDEDELFPDTLPFNSTFLTSQIIGNTAVSHFFLEQTLYFGAAKGALVGVGMIGANKAIKRFKAHRRNRAEAITLYGEGHDEEEI